MAKNAFTNTARLKYAATKKTSARKAAPKRTAAKKAASKKAAAKRAPANDVLTTAAKRAGRTLGVAARSVDKVAAKVKKTAKAAVGAITRTRKGRAKPKQDPQEAIERAKTRAMWKSQADDVTAIELAKHGALVDERARVRSVTGMSWSNRKPR